MLNETFYSASLYIAAGAVGHSGTAEEHDFKTDVKMWPAEQEKL